MLSTLYVGLIQWGVVPIKAAFLVRWCILAGQLTFYWHTLFGNIYKAYRGVHFSINDFEFVRLSYVMLYGTWPTIPILR